MQFCKREVSSYYKINGSYHIGKNPKKPPIQFCEREASFMNSPFKKIKKPSWILPLASSPKVIYLFFGRVRNSVIIRIKYNEHIL